MVKLYTKISNITKQVLYQYIKDSYTSLLNYHFKSFFQYCIEKNSIQVITHHFSNHKIEGLTIIDKNGISFSCERDNPKEKQNFTLCHELGHFVLEHAGLYFTETVDNQESIIEREANIFSAIVLMPDIVLLSKIYYSCDSFQKVQENLEVSKQALYFRLLDLFREYSSYNEDGIKQAIDSYIQGQNASVILLFHEIKEQIIIEFNQYRPSLIKQLQNRIIHKGFASSEEIPELLEQKNWDSLKKNIENLKIWLVYNKGKSVAYAWDTSRLTEKEARKKAELQLLLM